MNSNEDVCPNCGSTDCDNSKYPFALKTGTILNDKYIIGKVVAIDGEGIKYIAADITTSEKLYVKEYFPSEFAQRENDSNVVTVSAEKQAQYKALMYEFADLGKALKSLSNNHGILPVKDVFSENNTAYTVTEKRKTLSYAKFLEKCGGSLDWEQAKSLFMPLFGTLTNIHKQGILHCGISPQTVVVQSDGTLLLTDFEIPSARTAKSELKAMLYSGYSAPEQYNPSDWQGTWTDVYAMGAMLYTTLSGIVLPDAAVRKFEDTVLPLSKCCDNVSEIVAKTIMSAIEVSVQNRLQSMNEFSCRLIDNGNNTSVYTAEKGDHSNEDLQGSSTIMFTKQTPQNDDEAQSDTVEPENTPTDNTDITDDKKKNKNYIILAAAISGILLLLIVIIMLITFSGGSNDNSSSSSISSSSSQSSSSIEMDNTVPSFIGRYADDVKDNSAYTDRFDFTIKEEYNDEYPEGVIFKQSPDEGTEVTEKTTITLYVSKGPEESSSEESSSEEEKIVVPNFIGRDINDVENNQSYLQYFIFSVKYENKDDIAAGQIYDQTPSEGENVTGKTTVTLYVSKGPRMEIMPDVVNTQQNYAEKTLTDLNIKYTIEYVEDDSVVVGNVVKASKLYGETVYLDRDTIILYVNKGSSSSTSSEEENTDTPSDTTPETDTSSETEGA